MRERCVEPPSHRRSKAVTLSDATTDFVPVALAPAPEPVIRLEVARGAARVKLKWPVKATAACCVWLREWLA